MQRKTFLPTVLFRHMVFMSHWSYRSPAISGQTAKNRPCSWMKWGGNLLFSNTRVFSVVSCKDMGALHILALLIAFPPLPLDRFIQSKHFLLTLFYWLYKAAVYCAMCHCGHSVQGVMVEHSSWLFLCVPNRNAGRALPLKICHPCDLSHYSAEAYD